MKSRTATLGNKGLYTVFSYNDQHIRFRTSKNLKRYVRVKQWDHGYLVVDADYSTLGEVEEYIDITNILENLYIDPERFLKSIEQVVIEDV